MRRLLTCLTAAGAIALLDVTLSPTHGVAYPPPTTRTFDENLLVNGDVRITGNLTVNGRLFLNGVEYQPASKISAVTLTYIIGGRHTPHQAGIDVYFGDQGSVQSFAIPNVPANKRIIAAFPIIGTIISTIHTRTKNGGDQVEWHSIRMSREVRPGHGQSQISRSTRN
jgi:hypothetical protein